MKFQLRFCFRFFIVMAVLCPPMIAGGGCGGNKERPIKPTETFYRAKIVDMTLPATVKLGESPEFSVRLQMTEKMASLLPEKGYAALVPVGGREDPERPGQALHFYVSVYYLHSSDNSKNVEIDTAFPGFFRPGVGDNYPFEVEDPFAKNLSPGRYNVYARVPTEMPDDPIEYFGSFEVLPND